MAPIGGVAHCPRDVASGVGRVVEPSPGTRTPEFYATRSLYASKSVSAGSTADGQWHGPGNSDATP
jgi:hypothetical protein